MDIVRILITRVFKTDCLSASFNGPNATRSEKELNASNCYATHSLKFFNHFPACSYSPIAEKFAMRIYIILGRGTFRWQFFVQPTPLRSSWGCSLRPSHGWWPFGFDQVLTGMTLQAFFSRNAQVAGMKYGQLLIGRNTLSLCTRSSVRKHICLGDHLRRCSERKTFGHVNYGMKGRTMSRKKGKWKPLLTVEREWSISEIKFLQIQMNEGWFGVVIQRRDKLMSRERFVGHRNRKPQSLTRTTETHRKGHGKSR